MDFLFCTRRYLAGLAFSGFCCMCSAGEVFLTITNVANNKGHVMATLCDKVTFMKSCAFSQSTLAASNMVTLQFANITPGKYAIAVFHDENANGKLDKDAMGVPVEGYAFSMNARGKYSPPTFEAASFEVGDAPTRQSITLIY